MPKISRMASTSARFGFVFARRGITPEAASSWFLPRLVGLSTALKWCLTGALVPAAEALAATAAAITAQASAANDLVAYELQRLLAAIAAFAATLADLGWAALFLFVVIGAVGVLSLEYMKPLINDYRGNICAGVAASMMAFGAWIMNRMIQFEI